MDTVVIEFSLPENPDKKYRITDPRFGHPLVRFVLPDGRAFQTTLWLAARSEEPSRPLNAVPLQHSYKGSAKEIAKLLGFCVVAEEIKTSTKL